MLVEVGPLFRGRRLAIEIGCGPGAVILGLAGSFERVRGVDTAQKSVSMLEERAGQAGIKNARGFLASDPWDEPTGSADLVYSFILPSLKDRIEIANYVQRASMVLRHGGIAYLRFDTRPRTLGYRLRQGLPDVPGQRGRRTFRKTEEWVRDRMMGAELEIIGEQRFGTADHWVAARRR